MPVVSLRWLGILKVAVQLLNSRTSIHQKSLGLHGPLASLGSMRERGIGVIQSTWPKDSLPQLVDLVLQPQVIDHHLLLSQDGGFMGKNV